MRTYLSSTLAAAVVLCGIATAAAQGVGRGQTTTPQSAINPDDPALHNPQSPTSSNRGDPGSEALNPKTGGPGLGQGQQPAGTIGQAPADRQVVPPNTQPDDAATPVSPNTPESNPSPSTPGGNQLPNSANPNGR